ncbi:MAG: hypothetical protein IT318_13275 [Anaerolineales bacterium]|nr:hypothetical protein [Anaerolineales bacterium]
MPAANRNALFWGTVLILLGLAFLLNNFNVIPGQFIAWWPLLVMGTGLWLVAQTLPRRRGGGLVGGILLLALGGYWLARNFGWAGDGLFLPVVLIALGTGLLLRTLVREP